MYNDWILQPLSYWETRGLLQWHNKATYARHKSQSSSEIKASADQCTEGHGLHCHRRLRSFCLSNIWHSEFHSLTLPPCFLYQRWKCQPRLLKTDTCNGEINVLMLIKPVVCRYIIIPANRGKENKELGMALRGTGGSGKMFNLQYPL